MLAAVDTVIFCYKIYQRAVPVIVRACHHVSHKTSYLFWGTIMKLHLISGAVVLYTLLAMAAICLARLESAPQNVPF